MQPFEVTDFSGGVTDFILQAKPNQYADATNFLITPDKKLIERNALSAFIDGSGSKCIPFQQKVNSFMYFNYDTDLLVSSGENLYALTKKPSYTWTEITKFSGTKALYAGANSQISWVEFQRQLYIASDRGSNLAAAPVKIYKDTSGNYQERTVGMPKAYGTANWTDGSLLVACCTLANALKTSMLSHVNDCANQTLSLNVSAVTSGNLHVALDTVVTSALTVANATDQASLFTLVSALNSAYTAHMEDSIVGSKITRKLSGIQVPNYHGIYDNYEQSTTGVNLGPAIELNDTSTPTTVIQCARMLNNLYDCWYFHQNAINTHTPYNYPSYLARYAVSESLKITNLKTQVDETGAESLVTYSIPTITPDYTDFFNYVNAVKSLYNNHVNNTRVSSESNYLHGLVATWWPIVSTNSSQENVNAAIQIPDCTDLKSAYLLIYHLRNAYALHVRDISGKFSNVSTRYTVCTDASSVSYQQIAVPVIFTTSSGSASITAINLQTGSNLLTATVGTILVASSSSTGPFEGKADSKTQGSGGGEYSVFARVIASGGGTATVDRKANATVSGQTGWLVNPAWQGHAFFTPSGGTTISTKGTNNYSLPATAFAGSDTLLSTDQFQVGSDILSWKALLDEMFFALAAHMVDDAVHIPLNADMTTDLKSQTTSFYIPNIASYVYAFYFSDEYQVGANGLKYLIQGNPVLSDVVYMPEILPVNSTIASQDTSIYADYTVRTSYGIAISNIPSLSNDTISSYNTSGILFNIYRTTNANTVFYKVNTVTNGTTSYVDHAPDLVNNNQYKALISQTQIYTTGGVVGNDSLDGAKFLHIINGTLWAAGIYDTGQYFPNRLRQSLPFQPDSFPATFYDDFEDEITGLSSARGNLIVFCKKSVYRESGGFNLLGQGALVHDRISDTCGALNQLGIIQTEQGCFFAGTDGFYFTDGYSVRKLSKHLDKTYQKLTNTDNQKRGIRAAFDKENKRVYWGMCESEVDETPTVYLVLHVNMGLSEESSFTSIRPSSQFRLSACAYFNNNIIFGTDGLGYILRDDPWNVADEAFSGGSTSTGSKYLINYKFISGATDFGSIASRKYVTKVHMLGDNVGNQAIQISSITDKNTSEAGIRQLAVTNVKTNKVWGDYSLIWGASTPQWNNLGKIDQWRRIPSRGLRNNIFQIKLEPALCNIVSSANDYPALTFCTTSVQSTNITKVTLTMDPAYTLYWPNLTSGYTIYFSNDNFTTGYTILSDDGNHSLNIYISDTGNAVAGLSGLQFRIMGQKKEQRVSMYAYELHYSPLGDVTGSNYTPQSGEVGYHGS